MRSEARQEQLRFALALRERKSRQAGAPSATTPSGKVTPFPWWRRSFIPQLAAAAGLIVMASVGFIVWRASRAPSDLDRGLVALNTAYRQERPVEARLSDLDYAPLPNQRGATPKVDYVQRDLAANLLLKAATDNPTAASRRALGQYYLAERQFDKAIDQFNAALALDANDARSHINLGAALLEKGKLESGKPDAKAVESFARSLEHLNKGLELNSSSLEGYFNRALVYQYMMLPRDAEAAWRDYVQRDPNSQWTEEAKRNLKSLEESNNSGTVAMSILDDREDDEDDSPRGRRWETQQRGAGKTVGRNGFSIRAVPVDQTREHFRTLAEFYEELREGLPNPPPKIEASILLMAACQDEETTRDGEPHGVFTQALLDVWNPDEPKTYKQLIDGIKERFRETGIETNPSIMVAGEAPDLSDTEAFKI